MEIIDFGWRKKGNWEGKFPANFLLTIRLHKGIFRLLSLLFPA